MFRAAMALSTGIHGLCQRYGPSNMLIGWVRTRRGLKWGVPVMGIGVLYLVAASICIPIMEHERRYWLAPLVLLLLWNGLKLTLLGPVSLIWLARARYSEGRVNGAMPDRATSAQVQEPNRDARIGHARFREGTAPDLDAGYDPHPRERCREGDCPHCYYASRSQQA